MRIRLTSILPASADAVWAEVQRVGLLHEVARPLLVFRPAPGTVLPERWPVGVPVPLRLWAFGVVPLGPHRLLVERADELARVVQTRETSPLLRRWDHRIAVEPLGPSRTRYTDEIEIEAGVLTPLVGAVARVFFRHRHRRWQAVARRLGLVPLHP